MNAATNSKSYTLSLHDALPISKVISSEFCHIVIDRATQLLGGRGYEETNYLPQMLRDSRVFRIFEGPTKVLRSEEHTSELQSRRDLVCRLLLEKKTQRRARERS